MTSSGMAASYPISLEVDPAAPQNRLSVLLRIFYAIPHIIVIYLLITALQVVTFIAWIAILITGSYPQGMMNFAVGVLRWQVRAGCYYALLTDKYPPFSMEDVRDYPIRLNVAPQISGRNRLTVFFRILMIIPHAIALAVLGIVAYVCVVIIWIAALVTGTAPAGLHDFVANVMKWSARVQGYSLLMTDEYPPFQMG